MVTKTLTKHSANSQLDQGLDQVNGGKTSFNPEAYNLSKIGQLNRGNAHSVYGRPVSANRVETRSQPKFYSGSHCNFS